MLEPESVTCVMGHASTGAGAASADRFALWAFLRAVLELHSLSLNFPASYPAHNGPPRLSLADTAPDVYNSVTVRCAGGATMSLSGTAAVPGNEHAKTVDGGVRRAATAG